MVIEEVHNFAFGHYLSLQHRNNKSMIATPEYEMTLKHCNVALLVTFETQHIGLFIGDVPFTSSTICIMTFVVQRLAM